MIQFSSHHQAIYIDYTTVEVARSDVVETAASEPMFATDRVEAIKRGKYEECLSGRGGRFEVAAIETGGAMNKGFLKILKYGTSKAPQFRKEAFLNSWVCPSMLSYWKKRVSMEFWGSMGKELERAGNFVTGHRWEFFFYFKIY